ncbi:MAG: hypothetical protein QXI24_00020 [Acidilobaceae archaeon]
MRLKRGDISGPVLAILVTLLLIAIGVAIIAYFTFFAGGATQPVISITGQPVAYNKTNSAAVDITITNVGSAAVTLSKDTRLQIVSPSALAGLTATINAPVYVPPGGSTTLSFTFNNKWNDFRVYKSVNGILTLYDIDGNTVGVLEVSIKVVGGG